MHEKKIHGDDVIDDITRWPQSRLPIFLCEWKNYILHDNRITNKDIVFKRSVQMYYWIMNTPVQTHGLLRWLRYWIPK